MLVRRNLLPVKRKHRDGWLLLLFMSGICVAFSMTGKDDFDFGLLHDQHQIQTNRNQYSKE